jgi:hypothetical protein
LAASIKGPLETREDAKFFKKNLKIEDKRFLAAESLVNCSDGIAEPLFFLNRSGAPTGPTSELRNRKQTIANLTRRIESKQYRLLKYAYRAYSTPQQYRHRSMNKINGNFMLARRLNGEK